MPQIRHSHKSVPPKWRWLWIAVSAIALIAVLAWLSEVEDIADVAPRAVPPIAPVVSVLEVERAQAQATVSVFAELTPRWDAKIRSSVSGRVVAVHDAALAGTRVAEGTPLFSIQRTQFETAVAEAEVALEQARLTLVQAQNQVTIAERQFQLDGVEPPNELAVKRPQLRIAERGLNAAQTQLEAARRQLAETEVTAPFSGYVKERLVSLGQTVTSGEALLHLSDDRQFELVANLSKRDWSLLKHPVAGSEARLSQRNGIALGVARVRQGGGFLDPETRQMRVFLDVSGTEAAVLSGDFLEITFAGRSLPDTLTLPDGTMTRSGHIWFVDAANTLKRYEPVILFRADGAITIAAPEGAGPWRVAKTPLASFLPGQRVTPRATEG